MSSVAKGAQRVGSALSQFAKLGFRCSRVSASGQRKGARKHEKCIAGDLIALAPDGSGFPHVIAEIGGAGKRLRVAFGELRAEPLAAGFVPIVGRVVKRRFWWYSDTDSRHDSLREALDALR
jgi:hypothetical protein